jgi:hypothetical protein
MGLVQVQADANNIRIGIELTRVVPPVSGWDTRHPNRLLAKAIAGNHTEWWPGACKVRLTATRRMAGPTRSGLLGPEAM